MEFVESLIGNPGGTPNAQIVQTGSCFSKSVCVLLEGRSSGLHAIVAQGGHPRWNARVERALSAPPDRMTSRSNGESSCPQTALYSQPLPLNESQSRVLF